MKAPRLRAEPGPPPRGGVRARLRMTGQGAGFLVFTLATAGVALVRGENLALLMDCVVFATLPAAAWFAWRNLAGLALERRFPARARAGRAVRAAYRVHNRRRGGALALRIREALRGRVFLSPPPPATVASVGGRATTTIETAPVFARRGRHRLPPLEVRSSFPLGLFVARATVDAPATVLVRPREGRPSARLRAWLAGGGRGRLRASHRARGDDVFHGIREWRDGDDPRRIHWRTTARRGATTVTEWRVEQGRRAVVVLGRAPGAGRASGRTFERAVGVAATVWRAALGAGYDAVLDLGEGGGGGGASPSLEGGLDRLATVPQQGGRRPRRALRRLAARPRPRLVVYVAAGPEVGIASRLAAAAGRGGRWLLLRADRPGLGAWVRGLGPRGGRRASLPSAPGAAP